ncbi:MAG: peptidoglycan-binding domain-containing protein [Candidatus Omnitrophota bacterium]
MAVLYIFKRFLIYLSLVIGGVLLFSGCGNMDLAAKKASQEEKEIFGPLTGYNYLAKEAEICLDKAGFDPGPIDGVLDGAARKAVIGFQKSNNLKMSAFIDKTTWEKLRPYKITSKIDRKEKVSIKSIQQALKTAGFDPGPIDGKMGPKTKKAVTDFQRKVGLADSGKLDPKTLEKLKTYIAIK